MFTIELKDIKNGEVVSLGEKAIYNKDKEEKSLQSWLGGNGRNYTWKPSLKFSSGVNIVAREGKIAENAIGTFTHKGSTVEYNQQQVMLMSGRFSDEGTKTTQIFPENFMESVTLYAARKLIISDWKTKVDSYLVPNEDHEGFSEFSYDSIIFSIFSSHSLQNSIKDDAKGLETRNEFFFLSREEVKKVADKESNVPLFSDVGNADKETFVYQLINKIESSDEVSFSKEAQEVLNLGRELALLTIKYRESFEKNSPNYQPNRWDIGWYQIKGIVEYAVKAGDKEVEEKFNSFKKSFIDLRDKMTPMVYELGFLKK